MRVDLKSLKGKIDFAIISIREDEFLAVLERFAPDSYAWGDQRYEVGSVRCKGGGHGSDAPRAGPAIGPRHPHVTIWTISNCFSMTERFGHLDFLPELA